MSFSLSRLPKTSPDGFICLHFHLEPSERMALFSTSWAADHLKGLEADDLLQLANLISPGHAFSPSGMSARRVLERTLNEETYTAAPSTPLLSETPAVENTLSISTSIAPDVPRLLAIVSVPPPFAATDPRGPGEGAEFESSEENSSSDDDLMSKGLMARSTGSGRKRA